MRRSHSAAISAIPKINSGVAIRTKGCHTAGISIQAEKGIYSAIVGIKRNFESSNEMMAMATRRRDDQWVKSSSFLTSRQITKITRPTTIQGIANGNSKGVYRRVRIRHEITV